MKRKSRFSFRSTLIPSAVAAVLIGFCPIQTRANTIALNFLGSGSTITFITSDATFGWAFSLSNPVLLTDLGVWDGPNTPRNGSIGDGLLESHLVTIWTSTGTQVVGAQGTVPSGTAATLTNGFRYVSIAPVLLPAGNYTIGAFYVAGGNFDPVAVLAATVTTASGVTYDGGRSEFGNAFPLADAFASGNNSYFGPNFQFTAPPTNGVPDASSTWTLLLFGLTATFGPKFFVRRAA